MNIITVHGILKYLKQLELKNIGWKLERDGPIQIPYRKLVQNLTHLDDLQGSLAEMAQENWIEIRGVGKTGFGGHGSPRMVILATAGRELLTSIANFPAFVFRIPNESWRNFAMESIGRQKEPDLEIIKALSGFYKPSALSSVG